MIGRPIEDGRSHIPVDFDFDEFRPTLHLTLLQLLSLFAVLVLLFLIYGLRSLRRKLSSLGRLGDKESLGTKSLSEKHNEDSVQLCKDEKRGWWWIDAVVGTDEEERVQVDDQVDVSSRRYVGGAKLARWPSQPPRAHAQSPQSIPMRPRTPPPISMAKLIMSRHAHPPRRPRSPPKASSQQASQDSSHSSRSPSRLSTYVEV